MYVMNYSVFGAHLEARGYDLWIFRREWRNMLFGADQGFIP
jgi:hypothetical protein